VYVYKGGHEEDELADAFALGHGRGGGPGTLYNNFFTSYGVGQHSVIMENLVLEKSCLIVVVVILLFCNSLLY
jgi:hypothetical protein